MIRFFKKALSLLLTAIMIMSSFCLIGNTALSFEASAASHNEITNKMVQILYNNAGGSMTCDFDGYKNTYVRGSNNTVLARHEGIDFAIGKGKKVYSLISGTVLTAGKDSYNTIAIYDAENDKTVIYLHIDTVVVKAGQNVTKGQHIASESNCGGNFPVHTHVEVRNGRKTGAASSLGNNYLENDNPYPYWEKVLFSTQAINTSNSKININNCTIPKNINHGTAFDALSGTISTNDSNGLMSLLVNITDSSNNIVQRSVVLPGVVYGPVTSDPKVFSYSFLKLCTAKESTIDFSKLSCGTYKIQLLVSCAPKVREYISLVGFNTNEFMKSEYFLKSDMYEFTVTDGNRKLMQVSSRSGNGRTLEYDKNGNSYYTISCVLGDNSVNNTSGSGSSGSSGSGSSSSASSYQYRSGYSTGIYRVRVNSGWTLNLREEPSSNSRRLGTLSNYSEVQVTAVSGEWGFTNGGWINLGYTDYVSPLPAEIYNSVKYETGIYVAVKSSGIDVRSGAGSSYNVIKKLEQNTNFKIDRVDGAYGFCPDEGGWICLSYAGYVSPLAVALPKPDAPVIFTTTGSEIAAGDIIEVSWNAVDYADSYTLNLVDSSNGRVIQSQSGVVGTTASFTVPSAGTYNVTICGVNGQKTGYTARVSGITAHPPVTVVFNNWDGSELSRQQIKYGGTALPPATPTRIGHTFNSWSGGKLENIREDAIFTATFSRNSYKVTFYDYDGKTVLKTQNVLYGDAATPPSSYNAPTGYTFAKWNRDYSKITEPTSVKAVINWTSAYPLEIDSTSSIVRNHTAYITTAIVNNSPKAVQDARAIVSLKTSEGKELAEVSSEKLSLAAGEVKTLTLTANYDGAATVGNVFVVKADDEKIPLANSLTLKVDQGSAWTGWGTSVSPSNALETQSRTEYRYRTKSYNTSSDSSLQGWTKYNTTSQYSEWSSWSAWQDSPVEKTDLRDVKTQQAWAGYSSWSSFSDWSDSPITPNDYTDVETRQAVASSSTTYNYFRYSNSTGSTGNDYKTSSCTYYDPISLGSRLTERSSTIGGSSGQKGWKYWYNGTNYHTYWECNPCEVTTYTYKTQYRYRTRSAVYKTQYSYRTRSLKYTYYYYKWSDWEDWSPVAVTANADKEVETRTTYRYISNDPANIEDKSGVQRTVTGNAGAAYSGKYAILHVSSADGTTQYIGQSKISSTGSYNFVFKLKNEPTISSGDYIVTLSIEGNTSAIMLDPIPAPVPTYCVTFKNDDGTILETQQVQKGKDAVPPSPTKAGSRFTGWSGPTTNIQADTVLTAKYTAEEFNVVFVDQLAGTRKTVKFAYGDILSCPAVPENDAYDFLGWDAELDGITKVYENLVVRAVYQIKTFTVKFLGFEDEEMFSANVMFGDGVEPPVLENRDQYVFMAWERADELDYITEDMTIRPYFEYKTTVDEPSASIDTGSYNTAQTVTLTTGTEGASIFYTTDGTDPLEVIEPQSGNSGTKAKALKASAAPDVSNKYAGTLYTGPFTLDSSAELTYVAIKGDMNVSNYENEVLAINTPSTTEKKHLVTIHFGLNDYVYSYLVADNATAKNTEYEIVEYGYNLIGVYSDAAMTKEWNFDADKVTESIDLYLKWEKKTYSVAFLDKDGNIISKQSIAYMESAQAPAWELINADNFTFVGWDSDFSSVTDDMSIRAILIPDAEITSVSLPQKEITIEPNSTASLTASVTLAKNSNNDLVIWQSDDEDVVKVDESGELIATGNGTATVYAVSDDSGVCAACEVTVKSANLCINGHSWGTWTIVSNPSCTKTGLEKRVCCNDANHIETRDVPKISHKIDSGTVTTTATCMSEGTVTYKCIECGTAIKTETVKKTAHSYNCESIDPSCLEKGLNIYTCTVCGDVYTEPIAKVAHCDGDNDGFCDECGTALDNSPAKCSHLCHKTGIMGIIWKIINMFNKMFKINQYCECGIAHW